MNWFANWPKPRRFPWLLLVSASIILLDRMTKIWITWHIPSGNTLPVVGHLLRLSHAANYGGNFGIFAESAQKSLFTRDALIILNSLVMLVILAAMVRLGDRLSRASIGLAIALGGGLGCLHDRIAFGAVVDFIEVQIFNYHWPDFNIGDIAVVSGASLILSDYLLSKTRLTQPRTGETTA